MSWTLNSLVAEQHQADLIRTAGEYGHGHSAPRPRDSAFSRWVSMSHASLNQAKMAAPRSASGSSARCCP